MQGLILAGGKGKRLSPLTQYIQKCMLPIGTDEKPVLEYIIKLMKHYNIPGITILASYRSNQIINYFNHGERFEVNINYVLDKKPDVGTGGALINANNEITHDQFVLYYGDILSNINLSEMLAQHKKNNAVLTMALAKDFPTRVGVAELKNENEKSGKIINFEEKPMLGKPVNIGIYIIEKKALDILKSFKPKNEGIDLNRDVIPYLIGENMEVYGYLSDAFWYDVGSLERYENLEDNIVNKAFSDII